MILADSSAWIGYLRGIESDVNVRMRTYHEVAGQLAITDVVAMELLAGVRDAAEEHRVRRIVEGVPMLATVGPGDWEAAATLYRACRRRGGTARKLVDCLVAAVAIRNDVPVLHHDADFDVLARYTSLRLA